MENQSETETKSPSLLIDEKIEEFGDWRGRMLSKLRELIKLADPDICEELKWRGTPVWSHDGMICTGEVYKNTVKVTFAKGASLDDPWHIFNASLDGNARRAVDFSEGDEINEEAFINLIRGALSLNQSGRKKSKEQV